MLVHERIRRRRLRRAVKILLFFVAVGALGSVIYGFFFSGIFEVHLVRAFGAETIPPQEVERIASEFLKGRTLLIFPRNHPLFLNEKLLVATILERFPKIAGVSIHYRYESHVLELSLKERKPVAYWCKVQETCFLVDATGVIFSETAPDGGALVLRIYDQTGRNLRIGTKVLSDIWMMRLLEIREGLRPEVVIPEFIVEEESIGAHYVRANARDGWYVLFDTNEDPDLSVRHLKTLLAEEVGRRRNRLDYVDLRVPNRAYYRLR